VIRQTLDNSSPLTHLHLGYNYLGQGDYGEAAAEFQEAIKLGHNDPSVHVYPGIAYAKGGERERAQAILRQIEKSTEPVPQAALAAPYDAVWTREKALEILERAYETRDRQLYVVAVESAYDSLRSDPRVPDIMRKIGLPYQAS
jgi:Flp pilus assembly protein TadD